jgi:hypothetical protein
MDLSKPKAIYMARLWGQCNSVLNNDNAVVTIFEVKIKRGQHTVIASLQLQIKRQLHMHELVLE